MKRQNSKNTCLTDCVAFLLGIDPKNTPFFIESDNWIEQLQNFFIERGYHISYEDFSYEKLNNSCTLYLVQGLSKYSKIPVTASLKKKKSGLNHAVVYLGRKPFFDPGKKKTFLKGKPFYLWRITPEINVLKLKQ